MADSKSKKVTKSANKPSRVAAARAKASAAKTKAASAASATKSPVGGFMNFVREQGVIGLAVGLAIGTAAGASVKVIVDQFINPLVALLTQGIDLMSLKWVIQHKTASHGEVAIGWGAIVSSLITLLATAFVIYLIIHFAKLDRLDKKKDA